MADPRPGPVGQALEIVRPILTTDGLRELDVIMADGVIARIERVVEYAGADGMRQWHIRGYAAPAVRFEARLPRDSWEQRLLVFGPGGYAGHVSFERPPGESLVGSVLGIGGFAVATSDTGHRGSDGKAGDGLWAVGNPQAVADMAYDAARKVSAVVGRLVELCYGVPPRYRYYVGCSSGGRHGLNIAQRYAGVFDGFALDAPTIDYCATTTLWHAWNIQANSGRDRQPILTADRLPGLARAVTERAEAAGAAVNGLITQPWLVKFDPRSLVGRDPRDGGLTSAQAQVVSLLYDGPRDTAGRRLYPGGVPLGSELAWSGAMVPAIPGQPISAATCKEIEYDFGEFMADPAGPTFIRTWEHRFDAEHFARMHLLTGVYDPTNPDLTGLADAGGKVLLWQGLADNYTSPRATLNYYVKAREYFAERGRDIEDVLALFLVPGLHHGGRGGERTPLADFLASLIQWVELSKRPDRVSVVYEPAGSDGDTSSLDVFPYPFVPERGGEGGSEVFIPVKSTGLQPEHIAWMGDSRYLTSHTKWWHPGLGRFGPDRPIQPAYVGYGQVQL